MFSSPLPYFYDAVLRAPTIGCMLMCLAAALIGVIAYLRKQSLLGEALSHAAYPGVVVGVICSGIFSLTAGEGALPAILVLVGAFFTALLGIWTIHFLERVFRISIDSALCFVLSGFFGIGLTLASRVQFTFTSLYKQSLTYFYGQAATMTDVHIVIYGSLALAMILLVSFLYKELQVITFDREYAKSLGMNVHRIDNLVFLLIVLAVVVGIRSVGVVLMSAMLIAPAVAARQFSHRLDKILLLAGIFGLISGFMGNYLSVELTDELARIYPGARIALPTGPMIVMVATVICILSLLFAPERGLVLRMIRIARFRYQCVCENILKAIWRISPTEEVSFQQIRRCLTDSKWYLRWILSRLQANGWILKKGESFELTHDGELKAANIVRLHRLWEVYLADYLGVGAERVHRSAEEMEHIITPDLERELTLLLHDPKEDPHHQPIPPRN